MKTTIDIADGVLAAAKRKAHEEHTTLREVIEHALRRALAEEGPRTPFQLKDGSVTGNGLQAGIHEGNWEQLRELTYGL